MALVQITGTTFVRDTDTMGVINRDKNGLEDYLKKRNLMATQKEEINNMKTELSEIKQMLLLLINKSS